MTLTYANPSRASLLSRRLVRPLLLLGTALSGSVGLVGCSKAPGEEARAPQPVAVRTAKAEVRTLQPSFDVIGTVTAEPERVAALTAEVPGLVAGLAVREGTRVEKGDLVIQFNEQRPRIDLAKAQATFALLIAKPRPEEVALAQSAVDKAHATYVLAQEKRKRSSDFRASNPTLVPEILLKEEQKNEDIARAEQDAADAQLKLLQQGPREEQRRAAQIEVESAEWLLKRCRVTTPLAGEVTEIKARTGQRVDAGAALATVVDASEVLVQARVPSNRLEGLSAALCQGGTAAQGVSAKVRSAAFPGEAFPGVAFRLGQQTEAQTSDVPVWVRVPNSKGSLRIGMTVQLELFGAEVKGLAIPDVAPTVNEEGRRMVTVIREGKAYPTEIELSSGQSAEVRADGWVRVVKGLQEGDEVATENGYALPEGTSVVVSPPGEKAAGEKGK